MPHQPLPANGQNSGTENGHEGKVTFGFDVNTFKGRPLLRLLKWSIRMNAVTSAWGDSSSLGFENVETGRRSCQGSINAVFDINATDQTPISDDMDPGYFREGDVFPMQLWIGDESSWYWYFPQVVITNGPTYEVDVSSLQILEYGFQFNSIGPFFHPFDTKTIHNPAIPQPGFVTYPDARTFSQ